MKMSVLGTFAMTVLLSGGLVAQDPSPSSTTGTSQQNPPLAQSAPSSPSSSNGNPRIAPGSVIPIQLTKSLDAKKVKSGDEVDAKVTQDLKAGNGEIIVPKNTKVVGRVTEAQARNKAQKESQLGIAFDHAVMKNGEVALPMSIQAIIAQSYLSGGSNASEGGDQPPPPPTPSGMSQGNNGRTGSTGAPQASTSPTPGAPADAQSGGNQHQPITGNSQGVFGFPDLKLSTTANTTQGSVVSSENNNVKLDTGTLILLRVNQ
jgi:hypothetical protein